MISRNVFLKIIIPFTLLIKILIIIQVNDKWRFNPDEETNYLIAKNRTEGKGYVIYDDQRNAYITTSYYSSFTVFIYEILIKLNISKRIWIIVYFLTYLIVFSISVAYFFKLSQKIFENEIFSNLSTIVYCFYPSVLFYIGGLFFYENVGLSLLIIVVYKLAKSLESSIKKYNYIIIPFITTLSCLIRPQLILVYVGLFTLFLILIYLNRKKNYLLITATIIIAFLAHLPILLKNNNMFGAYILSTQPGFELLQGHNPYARGSWMGNWTDPNKPLYHWTHNKIQNLDELNEYEESEARKKLAIEWIKENPIDELKLILKKSAIYFLPMNYEILKSYNFPNPINALTHLFFAGFLIYVITNKKLNLKEGIVLAPIIGSILLSIIFFVGYRWRYYAEPFMIILAFRFLEIIWNSKLIKILKQ